MGMQYFLTIFNNTFYLKILYSKKTLNDVLLFHIIRTLSYLKIVAKA